MHASAGGVHFFENIRMQSGSECEQNDSAFSFFLFYFFFI